MCFGRFCKDFGCHCFGTVYYGLERMHVARFECEKMCSMEFEVEHFSFCSPHTPQFAVVVAADASSVHICTNIHSSEMKNPKVKPVWHMFFLSLRLSTKEKQRMVKANLIPSTTARSGKSRVNRLMEDSRFSGHLLVNAIHLGKVYADRADLWFQKKKRMKTSYRRWRKKTSSN